MKKNEENKAGQKATTDATADKRRGVRAYFADKKRNIEAQFAQLQQQYEECKAVLEALEEENEEQEAQKQA